MNEVSIEGGSFSFNSNDCLCASALSVMQKNKRKKQGREMNGQIVNMYFFLVI